MKKQRNAISRTIVAAVLIVIIVAAGAVGVYYASTAQKTSTSTTSSSTTSTTGSSSQAADTLTWAGASQVNSLDPDQDAGAAEEQAPALFYQSLINVNSSGQFIPELATGWNVSTNAYHYTFTLRQGVLFQDGTPFNATAVVVSLQRALAISTGLPCSFICGFAANATVLSTYQVEINLSHPNPDFLAMTASVLAFPIVSPSGVATHEINSTELGQAWFDDHEDGTGPYALTNFNPGVSLTAAQFPGYWQGWTGRHFTNIDITYVTDTTTRNLDLTSGGYDVAEDLSPTEVTSLNLPYVADTFSARDVAMVLFDLTNPYLSQLDFRTAIAYAVNYTALVANVELGQAGQGLGPLPAAMAGFNTSLPYPVQNITLAKEYLAKTNYTAAGSPTLTIAWNDYAWKQETCEAFASDMAAIGVNVNIVQVTYPVLAAGLSSPGTYDMYIFYQSTWVDGPLAILNTIYNGTYVSTPPVSNIPIAPLLKQAAGEGGDLTAYYSTIEHIQSIAVQQHYQLFLYDQDYNFAINSNKVVAYVPQYGADPTAIPDFYAMEPAS